MTDQADENVQLDFQQSWDYIEAFYREELLTTRHWQWTRPIVHLLRELRDAGYDQVLRAGQSMHNLGLSRSRKHGLRDDQPSVWIELSPNGTMRVTTQIRWDQQHEVLLPEIRLSRQLVEILDNLKREPIT
jgi:hypothetical protein